MSTMLSRLLTKEIRGNRGNKASCSTSRWYFPKIPDRLTIPIKSLEGPHNPDLRDTVLLGFLKDGRHLVGYTAREYEDEGDDFISGFRCIYTLSLWRFDDTTVFKRTPLEKVFECFLFSSDTEPLTLFGFLNICIIELDDHTLSIHGWQMGEGESCEHFVSIVAPPILQNSNGWSSRCIVTVRFESHGLASDGWEVVYVPGVMPTIVCNTGETLEYHQLHKTEEDNGITKLSIASMTHFSIEKGVKNLVKGGTNGCKNNIADYDVRLIGVTGNSVLFSLGVLYEESGGNVNPRHPSFVRRGTIFSLCPSTGVVAPIRSSAPVPHVPGSTTLFEQIYASQACFLRHWVYAPPSRLPTRLTNSSMVTGESLNYLFHPIDPVAIKGYDHGGRNGT